MDISNKALLFKNAAIISFISLAICGFASAFTIHKTTVDVNGNKTITTVDYGGTCPVSLGLDIYNPSYTVEIQLSCSDVGPPPCNVHFHIKDKLQASAFEVCGDLRNIDTGDCSLSTSVSLANTKNRPLLRILCIPRWRSMACSKNLIELQHKGLVPCSDFGKASISIIPFFRNHIYYMDSETSCSRQSTHQVKKGTIMSQHSLSGSEDLPSNCSLSFTAPQSETNLICVTFSYASFSCGNMLIIKESRTSTIMENYHCRHQPVLSKEKCFLGNGLGQFTFDLTRTKDIDGQGFVLYFEFFSDQHMTTAATTIQPTNPSTKATSEGGTSTLTKTIAISVSVLVAISVVVIIIKAVNSKYRPCCRKDDPWDVPPERNQLHNFSDIAADERPQATPSAPPLTDTRYGLEPVENFQPQPENNGTQDELGTTGNSGHRPPPSYDSLFTKT